MFGYIFRQKIWATPTDFGFWHMGPLTVEHVKSSLGLDIHAKYFRFLLYTYHAIILEG